MNYQKTLPPTFPWAYFGLAYGFSWLVWLPGVIASLGSIPPPIPQSALVTLGAFGPLVAAFFLTAREQGRAGVRQLWQQALNFKIDLRWLAVTLFTPLLLAAAAFIVQRFTSGTALPLPLLANPLLIVPTFVFIFFLGGPFQEEFGWRGYALTRLQRRWSAFTVSLILGVAWGLWHLPLFFMTGVSQSYLPWWAFMIWTSALSILLTWIYNNTHGNLIAVMLFHTMVNLALGLFPLIETESGSSQTAFIYLTLLSAVVAGLVTWRWGASKLSAG